MLQQLRRLGDATEVLWSASNTQRSRELRPMGWTVSLNRCLRGPHQATTFENACSQQNYAQPYILDLNYTASITFVSKANASEDYTPVVADL